VLTINGQHPALFLSILAFCLYVAGAPITARRL